MNKNSVAAVIVLYNPDTEIIRYIESVVSQVEQTYLIDNSENTVLSADILAKLPNTKYIKQPANLGIGAALNLGCHLAIEDHFFYILTMDQDTRLEEGTVSKLLSYFKLDEKIAIVSINHTPIEEWKNSSEDFSRIDFAMTSGNLLSLSAFKASGDFREDFFIDFVDHEFCLRLRSLQYSILRINTVFAQHNLGKRSRREFCNLSFFPTFHSPGRLYYRTRNRFVVNALYKGQFPDYYRGDKRRFFREIIEICLFEPNKFKKIKMIYKGYADYCQKIFGRTVDV